MVFHFQSVLSGKLKTTLAYMCVCARVHVRACVHMHVVMVAEIFILSKCNDMSGNQLHEYRNSNTSLFIIMDCCDD
jgi:hypothetical protein